MAAPAGATRCSREANQLATLDYADWFNNQRLLEPIGQIPPAEAEAEKLPATRQSHRNGGVI
jgi:hypothetical protein